MEAPYGSRPCKNRPKVSLASNQVHENRRNCPKPRVLFDCSFILVDEEGISCYIMGKKEAKGNNRGGGLFLIKQNSAFRTKFGDFMYEVV